MNKSANSEPKFSAAPSPSADGRVSCGDIDIRIGRDGTWYYHGSPIGRKELVCLFASVLRRDDRGDYWLITPAEEGRIRVDDAPFIAVELFAAGAGRKQNISLRTNVDEIVALDDDHPLRVETNRETGEPSPYVTVRESMEARLSRPVYYELVDLGTEETRNGEKTYGVWSCGTFFAIGKLDGEP